VGLTDGATVFGLVLTALAVIGGMIAFASRRQPTKQVVPTTRTPRAFTRK
jgi:hypothetical protein